MRTGVALLLSLATVAACAHAAAASPLPRGFQLSARGPAGGTLWSGEIAPSRRASSVYLPPGYSTSVRYPAVFVLAGMPGSLVDVADMLIATGRARPFVAVAPAAAAGSDRDARLERHVVHDVVPWADRNLSIVEGARGRTIAGLSAGGLRAVDVALLHPRLFDTVEVWGGCFKRGRDGPLSDLSSAADRGDDPADLARHDAALLRAEGTRFFLSSGLAHGRATPASTDAFAALLSSLDVPHALELVRRATGARGRELADGLAWAFGSPPRSDPTGGVELRTHARLVRTWVIHYVAHDGALRRAFVELPAWYGPYDDPPIPLIISPHGRGVPARLNVRRWGSLPAKGGFAVVNPEGQGRVSTLFSWGSPGDVADLARMPRLVHDSLPWLHIDVRRIYAFGGSMGGQETLLLVAHYPRLLAGAASFDAPTNMAARFRAFPLLRFGLGTQRLAELEIGGTPATDPAAYAERSPLHYAPEIAYSYVPLQIWWSREDHTVTDGAEESGLLYKEIMRLNPAAPVVEHVGLWMHTAEMRAATRLPAALSAFGLLRPPRASRPTPAARARKAARSYIRRVQRYRGGL